MSWSLAEICALAARAARGGGAPPGQAARFGHVAGLFLMAGGSATVLRGALDALPGGPILDHPRALDQALGAAGRGQPGLLSTGSQADDLLRAYVQALPFRARLEAAAGGAVRLLVDLGCPAVRPPLRRIAGCGALVAHMEVLAARTYVPETENSRLTGAGAGLSDND